MFEPTEEMYVCDTCGGDVNPHERLRCKETVRNYIGACNAIACSPDCMSIHQQEEHEGHEDHENP